MNKIIPVLLLTLFSLSTYAQQQSMDLETLKTLFKTEKRLVVKNNMNLSVEEAKDFWAIYDEYELERTKLASKRTDLYKKYVQKYDTLTDDETNEIVVESVKMNKSELKLKNKYYKVMKKSLSTKTAARFFQIDGQINNILRLSISQEMPLISNIE